MPERKLSKALNVCSCFLRDADSYCRESNERKSFDTYRKYLLNHTLNVWSAKGYFYRTYSIKRDMFKRLDNLK